MMWRDVSGSSTERIASGDTEGWSWEWRGGSLARGKEDELQMAWRRLALEEHEWIRIRLAMREAG